MVAEIGKALGEVLAEASFDERSVRELVRVDDLDFGRGLAALRLRPSGGERLGLLVRLFIAAESLDPVAVATAVAPLRLEELAAAGIIERGPDGVRALCRLDPVDDLIVASDPHLPGHRLSPDHVIMAGPASRTLAAVTLRPPRSTALDLCCGSGVQALLAARHCEHVVGTDVNPRALRLAALSASLSGVQTVEWRLGDLFEPVLDEQFEFAIANPPFVISPTHEFTFRDGGRSGDELSRLVLTGLLDRLSEGGLGHVLCSWVGRDGEHWSDQPRRWLERSGCDAVIFKLDSESPATHAISWTSLAALSAGEAVARAADWVDYYRDLGVAQIVTGVVIARRRGGENWVVAEELVAAGSNGGDHVARIFTGNDTLAALPDDQALLGMAFELPPHVHLVERWSRGGTLERARLTADEGLRLQGRVQPPRAAALLLALDGERTLAEAAAGANVSPAEVGAALPSLRDLVRRGFVTAAPSSR